MTSAAVSRKSARLPRCMTAEFQKLVVVEHGTVAAGDIRFDGVSNLGLRQATVCWRIRPAEQIQPAEHLDMFWVLANLKQEGQQQERRRHEHDDRDRRQRDRYRPAPPRHTVRSRRDADESRPRLVERRRRGVGPAGREGLARRAARRRLLGRVRGRGQAMARDRRQETHGVSLRPIEGLPRRSRRVSAPCGGDGGKVEQHEVPVVPEPEAIETECRHRSVPRCAVELGGEIEQPHLHRGPSRPRACARAAAVRRRAPRTHPSCRSADLPAGQPVQPPDSRNVAARGADGRRVRRHACGSTPVGAAPDRSRRAGGHWPCPRRQRRR